MPVGSALNEGLGRTERPTPRWVCTNAGCSEEGRLATFEPRDTDGKTGSPTRVPLDGTTQLALPGARAKKGRCPAEGTGLIDAAGSEVEKPTFDYQSAERRGFEVVTTIEAEHKFLVGWPNERS